MREPDANGRAVESVPLGALFIAFLKISLCGFGGGIVWAHRIAVEQKRWISDEQFADILTLCQFLPGPNVVGIAVCVGAKRRGSIGAIAAVGGFLLIPWTIGFITGMVLLRYAHLAVMHDILGGISAAAAGLLIATGLRMLRPHRSRPWALAIAALAFGGIVFSRLPFLVVLLGLATVGMGVAGMENPRPR